MSWDEALAGLEPPFAFVDLDAVAENSRRMLAAADGKPIRIASKSVRSRPLLQRFLASGYQGLLNFTLREALWLHSHGFRDLLVAYPSVEPEALAALAELDPDTAPTLMVDCIEQLDLIGRAKVAIDLDVGYWPLGGRLKFGPKRSPIRTPEQARALAEEILSRPNLTLAGVMAYEGQIAGLADRVPGRGWENLLIRAIKHYSAKDVAERRAAMVHAIRELAPIGFVNGGGTGSIPQTCAEACVSEVTAGSGFYAPQLFQYYRGHDLLPAAGFCLSVNRRPDARTAAALGGGYIASGPTRK
ncbi:MAG: alanine racemase, partial [Solirubrobacterales bacterium]|nr:alanine racemase [Solirubrobacterales bacterium]